MRVGSKLVVKENLENVVRMRRWISRFLSETDVPFYVEVDLVQCSRGLHDLERSLREYLEEE